MKFRNLLPILLLSFSCQKNGKDNIDSLPFAVVVKYISAENLADTIEAKKYINIEKAFANYIDKENPTAYKAWINQILFFKHLANDRRNTNCFKFQNYTFKQIINNGDSEVLFVAKNKKSKIKEIKYTLNLDKKNEWVITGIEFKKR